MKGHIVIEFDTDTGKLALKAPMEDQAQKNLTVKIMGAALGAVVDYVPQMIIKPAIIPIGTNGKPLVN